MIQLEPGVRLGPYQVLSLLGRGGMGEVWRARDTTLRRDVALKVLPPAMAQDPGRLTRFRQEAQVLASLNHPHVASIYGFEETGSSPALVLELVEGQTLAARLSRGPLPQDEALRIAAQIAGALEAAHERGIVHRDLKPGNVMLRVDGTVKVLDFGLATALRPQNAEVTATAVLPASLTAALPGMVVGTPAYMAPEQARSEAIDSRADIWAFGCVLYELLTGRAAFGAPTATESLAKVLEGRVDLDALPTDTPPSIRRLVRRCLERSLRDRLQHIGDARADITDATSDAAQPPRRQPSAYGLARSLSVTHLIVAIGAVLLVIAAMVWTPRFFTTSTLSLADAEIVPLTASGNATLAVIAPNGHSVVYVQTDDTKGDSLRVKQIDSGADDELVAPQPGVKIRAVTLSPDGVYAYYVAGAKLWRTPTVGSTAPTFLIEGVNSPIAWAPDGTRFAFIRLTQARRAAVSETTLMVVDAETLEERALSRQELSEHGRRFQPGFAPAWSPDGATIAIPGLGFEKKNRLAYLMFVTVIDGSVRAERLDASSEGVTWVDGNSLLLTMPVEEDGPGQLWLRSHPDGLLDPLTNDLSNYGAVSLSEDGDRLVTTQENTDSQIWVGDGAGLMGSDIDTSAARPDVAAFSAQIAWVGDRLLYAGRSSGRLGLFNIRPGSGLPPERSRNTAYSPAPTTDGGPIVYISGESSERNSLWRMDSDGRNRILLVKEAVWPVTTESGHVVFASSSRTSAVTLWRVPLDGGPETQITHVDSRSPDVFGDKLAFVSSASRPDGELGPAVIMVCEVSDCASPRALKAPGLLPSGVTPIRWTRDGQAVAYVNASAAAPNIWIQPVDGSEASELTRFTDGKRIASFAYSRDFTRLAILRETTETDIVLFKGTMGGAGNPRRQNRVR